MSRIGSLYRTQHNRTNFDLFCGRDWWQNDPSLCLVGYTPLAKPRWTYPFPAPPCWHDLVKYALFHALLVPVILIKGNPSSPNCISYIQDLEKARLALRNLSTEGDVLSQSFVAVIDRPFAVATLSHVNEPTKGSHQGVLELPEDHAPPRPFKNIFGNEEVAILESDIPRKAFSLDFSEWLRFWQLISEALTSQWPPPVYRQPVDMTLAFIAPFFCAAVAFSSRFHWPLQPLVVLSSLSPTNPVLKSWILRFCPGAFIVSTKLPSSAIATPSKSPTCAGLP